MLGSYIATLMFLFLSFLDIDLRLPEIPEESPGHFSGTTVQL